MESSNRTLGLLKGRYVMTRLIQDLERYADMLADGELISPDDLNCSSVMHLAAEVLAHLEKERCSGCEACIHTACGREECPKGWLKAP